jgi:hypothetical protein
MDETSELVKELLISGITGLIAALFAVRISLQKFSSQKWWERREEAYSKIIGVLSALRVYLGNWEEDVLNIRNLNQEEKQGLFKKMREEGEKIEQIASEDAFRITKKSNKALHELVKSLGSYGEYQIEGLEIHTKAVSECLDIIKTEAKKDLRINKKWYQV